MTKTTEPWREGMPGVYSIGFVALVMDHGQGVAVADLMDNLAKDTRVRSVK